MKSKTHTVAVIGGDGIGPDVIEVALELLNATKIKFTFKTADAGFGAYEKYGTPLPDKTIEICEKSDAVLFGAVTSPPNIEGYFSPIVRLRKHFDLYSNVRPIFSLPLESVRQNVDFTVVRENTEDLYTGKERLTKDGAIAERVITTKGSARIVKYAFDYAVKHSKKKVTVVHKANVLRLTDGLFLRVAQEIAQQYPDIIMEDLIVDNCAMQIVKNPERFEVIVTTNMFGDILSDESSALVGGLGVVASANIGKTIGLFEPVHGSAPKYAGQNVANPMATFFATSMMLTYLGETDASNRIKTAIIENIKKNLVTKDLGGTLSTKEFTTAVINNLN